MIDNCTITVLMNIVGACECLHVNVFVKCYSCDEGDLYLPEFVLSLFLLFKVRRELSGH